MNYNETNREKDYRLSSSTDSKGVTLYAVEVFQSEEQDWGIVKVFNSKTAAREHLQSLQAYGK